MEKVIIRIAGSVLLLLAFLQGNAQQQPSKRICDTIHYEYHYNKIIIPVTVNGIKVKYIVDTGGQTGTDWKHVKEMKARATGASNATSDLNGMKHLYQMAEVKDVRLSEHFILPSMKTMVLPVLGGFKDLGVVGILGGDAFAQSVVTFDSREHIMVINHPYRPDHLKLSDGVAMYPGHAKHSIIDVSLGGNVQRVLFDTGASGMLVLSQNHFQSLAAGRYEIVSEGFGISGIGLEGLPEPEKIRKVNVGEMKVLDKTFTHAGTIVSNRSGSSIVGVDLLKYGKVVIDYMRNRFFFFPFDEEVTDLGGPEKIWNVEILPANDRFEVTTVWESIMDKVHFGEQVVGINGTDITSLPLSQFEVDKVMAGIEGDTAYITILRNGKRIKVDIRKE